MTFTLDLLLFVKLLGKGKGEGKVIPVHVVKAHMGSRGIAPLIFNLGVR